MSVWTSPSGCYVIAEVGLNHNGDLERAIQLIEEASLNGANAVKFQKRTVDLLATREILDAPDFRFPSLGRTYRELRERHEFNMSEFERLKKFSEDLGLDFFVTPFDVPALEFLDELGVDRYKVASHGLTNLPLLEAIASRHRPVLLSTGMSSDSEIRTAVSIIGSRVSDLALLHCVSAYPTPPEEARLDLIASLTQDLGLRVGYSGHEIGFDTTLVAVAAGARIVERHITLDTTSEGFDHKLSLNPSQFGEMVSQIGHILSMFGSGPRVVTESELITRAKYQVSMVSTKSIAAGSTLTESDFSFKNPGTGIKPEDSKAFLGRKLRVSVGPDTLIDREMFEDA